MQTLSEIMSQARALAAEIETMTNQLADKRKALMVLKTQATKTAHMEIASLGESPKPKNTRRPLVTRPESLPSLDFDRVEDATWAATPAEMAMLNSTSSTLPSQGH